MTGKPKSKIATVVLFALLITAFAIQSTPAIANNHQDRPYLITLPANYGSVVILGEEKTDTTSSYRDCQGAGAYHTVQVMARTSRTGTVQDVGSPILGCPAGYAGYLYNWVYEEGYRWAALKFTNLNSFSGSAYGVWSPDSV
ncbi:MAG: hypothetical protein LBS98_06380 [Coriobacteriales bacterium]|jgi:hypothetical protein|nr:hypothetical protein [Coriobacteriales bacterium]